MEKTGGGASTALLLVVTLVLASCTDEQSPFVPVIDGAPQFVQQQDYRNLDRLTHAFALAFQKSKVRASVRDAMRASLFTEHKLVLQKFVSKQSGHLLIQVAAKAAGSSPGDLRQIIARSPKLDFYVPFREHRLTWTGGSHVIVGWTLDVDAARITAVGLDGKQIVLDKADGVPDRTLFLLQPAEPKGIRINPQPSIPGKVIQEPSDGEVSGQIIRVTANGDTTIVELARIYQNERAIRIFRTAPATIMDRSHFPTKINGDTDLNIESCPPGGCEIDECPEFGCSVGGGHGDDDGTDPTRLYEFLLHYGDGVGSAEVEYTINDQFSSKTVRFEGLDEQVLYRVREDLWSGPLSYTSTDPNVEVVETDAFFDDPWGVANVRSGDNMIWKATLGFCGAVGDPNTDIQPECAGGPQHYTVTTEFRLNW